MGPLKDSLWEDLLQVFYPEEMLVAICDTFSIASKEYRITSIPKIMTTTYLRITGKLKNNKKKTKKFDEANKVFHEKLSYWSMSWGDIIDVITEDICL